MDLTKCFITKLPVKLEKTSRGGIEYTIKLEDNELFFRFSDYPEHWCDDIHKEFEKDPKIEKLDKNRMLNFFMDTYLSNVRHIIYGLLLNKKFDPLNYKILNKIVLDRIISESDYPKTPKEKINNLFISLYEFQNYDGELIYIDQYYYKDNLFFKYYFKTKDEFNFYLNSLYDNNLIFISDNERLLSGNIQRCKITYEGLNHLIEITNEGVNSKNCFVAMSFDKSEDHLYFEAIKPAIESTGFNPIRIDYENYDSDKTINDAIIAGIKKCKFCISDFTKQKAGVYFETGYALGRNMKVIYSCHEDDFSNCHFDTNHYPHINYKTTEELKVRLKDKIEAYIL